ncbi:MAG: iron-sulfur cluster assembly scaffold protein, partial [Elsteraceae bacterium]
MSDLYQEALMALAKDSTHAGALPPPAASVMRDNPLCGDRVTVDLVREGDKIADIRHKVRGCVLCRAAASALTASVVGAPKAKADAARAAMQAVLAGQSPDSEFESFAAFAPVASARSRHTCVLLPFDALDAAWSEAS